MNDPFFAHWSADVPREQDARVVFEATEDGAILTLQLESGVVYRVEARGGLLTASRGSVEQVVEPLKRRMGRPRGAKDTYPRVRRPPAERQQG
jgi:hypothetical protein